jgi:hypothetical protein
LALLSAVSSFYWAFGGTAGLGTVGGAIEELALAHDARAVALGTGAGVAKVAAGLLALSLVRPWGQLIPRWLRLGAAWLGSGVLIVYGGLLVAVGALVLTGVIDPTGPVDRTALRWHVMFWDPLVPDLGPPARPGRLATRPQQVTVRHDEPDWGRSPLRIWLVAPRSPSVHSATEPPPPARVAQW